MTGRVAMIDGVLSPLDEAKVSVLDRGFLYGDSVFETIRTYGGRPFELEGHMKRLERSAALVYIDLPVSRETLASEVEECVRAAGNHESYIRVTVTRGSGELGLDPALAARPLRVIVVAPLHPPAKEAYEHGISAIKFATRRASDGTGVAGAKIGNYLVSVLAMREARAAGALEALIVDAEGRMVEGATSNVFFVRGKKLVTPPEGAGILLGITRAIVIEAAKSIGIDVVFEAPPAAEVFDFDEMFISSSIRELLAVTRLDGREIGTGDPGPVYRRLLAAFRQRIGSRQVPPAY